MHGIWIASDWDPDLMCLDRSGRCNALYDGILGTDGTGKYERMDPVVPMVMWL